MSLETYTNRLVSFSKYILGSPQAMSAETETIPSDISPSTTNVLSDVTSTVLNTPVTVRKASRMFTSVPNSPIISLFFLSQ